MKRVYPVLLTLGLSTACSDPSTDDGADDPTSETQAAGDGDGDSGDGDGDSGDGDGDGDSGDGDGDGDSEPPDIPDGLFAAIPGVQSDKLALTPDHLFVIAQESFFDDPQVLKVSKFDADVETFHVVVDTGSNSLIASDSWLYSAGATPVFRSPFDASEWLQIAEFGGVGGIQQLVATSSQLFVRRINANDDTLHRINPDGSNPTLLLTTGDINGLRTNGTLLYGLVDGNVARIDTQTGAPTPVYQGTTGFWVGEATLYFDIDPALYTAAFDGSNVVELVSEADVGGNAITYAEDGEYFYWATDNFFDDNTLRRVPVGGGAVEILATLDSAQDIHQLRVDDTHVWWLVTGGDEDGIWRATK